MTRTILPTLIVLLAATGIASGQTREEKVQADRKKYEADGFWIYNDFKAGIAEAQKTGKPMLVVMRCIPCEECVKLDDELVNADKRVRPLLEKFVRVRIVSTNGLDLSLFQFDYDQSWGAFLLNADGTIYGRFGTRSHRTYWFDDVSLEGLAKALEGALELHASYPKNKAELVAKRGPAPDVSSPEKYPLLKDKYGPTLADTKGKVVQSCIHCHQIGDAQRQVYRDRKEPIPEQLLFSYPHPKIIGLILDPKERATVREVEKDSLAEKAGFQKGDVIVRLEGQPLLSIADVQWILHQAAPPGATLTAQVQRKERTEKLTLVLPKGWRQRDDLSWRSSTWNLRRMALGGLFLESMTPTERKDAKLPQEGMALRVKHVGEFGPHAAAKNAGFRKGDILVSFDGRTDLPREAEVLAYALGAHQPGARVAVGVVREGKRMDLMLPMQP